MIKITKITPLKQEQAAIEINNNGTILPHITTLHLVMRYHLEQGKELSKEEYNRFIKDNEIDILYNKALQYISYQMRTISEVKKHLKKTTQDESTIQSIINKLKDAHYLSDSDYVAQYVQEKLEFDLVGPLYIKNKLIKKGIHYNLIDGELLTYSDDLQFEKITELLSRNIRYTIKKPYRAFIQSMKRTLLTKGFTLDIIDSAILAKQDDIMAHIDEEPLLLRDLQKLLQLHDITTYQDKQKVIQKLLRKGYSLPSIKKSLNQEENK